MNVAKRGSIHFKISILWEFLEDYKNDNYNPAVDWAFILCHRLAKKGVVIKEEQEISKS